MKLIDILIQELPKRGGWPEGAEKYCSYNGEAGAYKPGGIEIKKALITGIDTQICDVVYAGQYEAALDAKNDGWIEWGGGECQVDSDAIVEVKYRKPNPYQYNNDRAGDFAWAHDDIDGDIIAYRLHDQGINHRANDDRLEQDLNECIGQGVDVPEWNGEGLPPAGCECEARYRNADKWVFFRCIGVDCGVAFGWLGKEAATLGRGSYEFRPLRTEAERAREASETAIRTCLAGTGAGITPLAAKGIYDAIAEGKIPGVKLEDK